MIHDRPGVRLDSIGILRMLQSREIESATVDAGRRIQSIASGLAPKQTFDTNPKMVPTLSRRGGTTIRAGAEVSTLPDHWGRVRPSIDALKQAAKQSRGR